MIANSLDLVGKYTVLTHPQSALANTAVRRSTLNFRSLISKVPLALEGPVLKACHNSPIMYSWMILSMARDGENEGVNLTSSRRFRIV